MKKFGLVLLMLTVLSAFAIAQTSGPDADTQLALDKENKSLGLEAGTEIYFGDVADKFVFGLAPIVKYDNSFGNFDLYGEAQYFINFDDNTVQTFYLEEEVAYNIPLQSSVLSFILNNQNNFFISPSGDYDGVIEPSALYGYDFSFGTLSAQLGFPIGYAPEAIYDSYLNLAFYRSGAGIEVKAIYNIDPFAKMAGYELLLNYEKEDAFYAEVEVDTDKEFDVFVISPYFEFYVSKITLWAGIDFGNIGGIGNVTVEPYIGASYKF